MNQSWEIRGPHSLSEQQAFEQMYRLQRENLNKLNNLL
uniref:Uncharacterized protein n=1 Tax=Anguilla anguilla TaxID=7936 RepID=A0A0E9U3F7_ANGAN